jgi:hypothetical protein
VKGTHYTPEPIELIKSLDFYFNQFPNEMIGVVLELVNLFMNGLQLRNSNNLDELVEMVEKRAD